jgi:hypothetical protein
VKERLAFPDRRDAPCGWRGWALLLVLASAAACDRSASSEERRPGEDRPPVFTERRFLQATVPTKQLGEDCQTSGSSECTTGICLHWKRSSSTGFVCTVPCGGPEQCPVDWTCAATHSTEGSDFCVPPSHWEFQVATVFADGGTAP